MGLKDFSVLLFLACSKLEKLVKPACGNDIMALVYIVNTFPNFLANSQKTSAA
jgi:hypothetical protein